MRIPPAGSRPAITSQKLIFVFNPTPSGVGQVISGTTFFAAAAGVGGGFRAGAFRVCAVSGTVSRSANTAIRMTSVYVGRTGRTGLSSPSRLRFQVLLEEIVDPVPG